MGKTLLESHRHHRGVQLTDEIPSRKHAAEFDQLLQVRVRNPQGAEHEKVLRVPSFKPAQSITRRFTPPSLELAFAEALAAQHLHVDAEALVAAFTPLLQFVEHVQPCICRMLSDVGPEELQLEELLEIPRTFASSRRGCAS